MFFHVFRNTLKVQLRNRSIVFWAVLFPIILSVMFKFAFGNLVNFEEMDPIEVAVVEPLSSDRPQVVYFEDFLQALNEEGDDKILEIKSVNRTEAISLLEQQAVVGIIDYKDQPELTVFQSGVSETILQSLLKSYVQNETMITKIFEQNPEGAMSELLPLLAEYTNYLENKTSDQMDHTNLYFFSLIGMQLIYGYMWGLRSIMDFEANLSTIGKRQTVAPIHKLTAILAAFLTSVSIHLVLMLFMWAWLAFGLGVDFGNQSLGVLALMILGSFTGVSFGVLLGVSNRKSLEAKINMGVAITMTMTFLAGMMIIQVKPLIATYLPWLAKINPVNVITDALYALYYFPTLDRFFSNLWTLGVITLLFIGLSFFFMRGKRYDHL